MTEFKTYAFRVSTEHAERISVRATSYEDAVTAVSEYKATGCTGPNAAIESHHQVEDTWRIDPLIELED